MGAGRLLCKIETWQRVLKREMTQHLQAVLHLVEKALEARADGGERMGSSC
jgi:hypothetical protein